MSIIYRDKKVSFTINGEKFEGVLRKGLEMANKDKYIPKVGDNFQYKLESDSWIGSFDCECLAIGKSNIFIFNKHTGNEYLISIIASYEFRPIPTKADVEREVLMKLLNESVVYEDSRSEIIQKAGFTIPKRVKREELANVIWNSISDISKGQAAHAADKVCELLGDLVENDQ